MDCSTHTKTQCDFVAKEWVCKEIPICVYSIAEVQEMLKPHQLDSNRDTYSKVEQASFSHALQPLERRPSIYDPINEEHLQEIKDRMVKAYKVLKNIKLPAPSQVIWLTIDSETEKRLLKAKFQSRRLLEKLAGEVRKFFCDLNINFVISEQPPSKPYTSVILTDTNEAVLRRTKKQRVLAVKDMLLFGGSEEYAALLNEIIGEERVQHPGLPEDDLYDRAAQNNRLLDKIPFKAGWATLGYEDIGNKNQEDIAYVRLPIADLKYPEVRRFIAVVVAHEVGHTLGLAHTDSVDAVEKTQCVMIKTFMGDNTEETKRLRRKEREETEKTIKKMDPQLLRAMGGRKKLLIGNQEMRLPPYHFGDQALTYLRFILGKRKPIGVLCRTRRCHLNHKQAR